MIALSWLQLRLVENLTAAFNITCNKYYKEGCLHVLVYLQLGLIEMLYKSLCCRYSGSTQRSSTQDSLAHRYWRRPLYRQLAGSAPQLLPAWSAIYDSDTHLQHTLVSVPQWWLPIFQLSWRRPLILGSDQVIWRTARSVR